MHLFARICACVLSLLVAFELAAAQRLSRPVLMPTEEAVLAYLAEQQDVQLPLLTQLAAGIRSQQEADAAVYELSEYLSRRAAAFRKLPTEPLSPAQAAVRMQHLLAAETELMQSEAATSFRREETRLRAAAFFHSVTLRDLWESYVGRNQLSRPQADAEMTLLALDAFAVAGFRGNADAEAAPLSPATPNLRGEGRTFEDCFCCRYCFRAAVPPATKALSGAPAEWAQSSPRALLALTREAAGTLPSLHAEHSTADDTFFLYRLTPPFRSPYLVIIFPKTGEHPGSFVFTDEPAEFTEMSDDGDL